MYVSVAAVSGLCGPARLLITSSAKPVATVFSDVKNRVIRWHKQRTRQGKPHRLDKEDDNKNKRNKRDGIRNSSLWRRQTRPRADQLRAGSTNRSQHFICSPFHTYFCRRPPGCLQLYVACRMFPSHFVGTVSIVLINCGPERIVLMSTIHAFSIIEAAGKRCSLIKTVGKTIFCSGYFFREQLYKFEIWQVIYDLNVPSHLFMNLSVGRTFTNNLNRSYSFINNSFTSFIYCIVFNSITI